MASGSKTARIAGSLFLTAMVTSLAGGAILDSIIASPGYLTEISTSSAMMQLGILLELINSIAVVGIAVMMFPVFRQLNESVAMGYVGFRIIESLSCVLGAFVPVLLIWLSQTYLGAAASGSETLRAIGPVLLAARTQILGLLVPVFFCLGAFLFYSSLYRMKLVARFISIWGLVAVVLVLTVNLVELNLALNLVLALPIIANEVFLGIWLIVKGFNPEAVRFRAPA